MTTEGDSLDIDDWYSDAAATFGDRVAAAREAVGLTQQELAARLGIKLKTLRDWENDLNDPRSNKLQMLSGVLNVSIAWLLTGAGEGLDHPRPTGGADDQAAKVFAELHDLRRAERDLAARLSALEDRLHAVLKA